MRPQVRATIMIRSLEKNEKYLSFICYCARYPFYDQLRCLIKQNHRQWRRNPVDQIHTHPTLVFQNSEAKNDFRNNCTTRVRRSASRRVSAGSKWKISKYLIVKKWTFLPNPKVYLSVLFKISEIVGKRHAAVLRQTVFRQR